MDKKDFEAFEAMIYKNGDDISVAIGRSFQHLEDYLEAMETRIFSKIGDLNDRVEECRRYLAETSEIAKDINGFEEGEDDRGFN